MAGPSQEGPSTHFGTGVVVTSPTPLKGARADRCAAGASARASPSLRCQQRNNFLILIVGLSHLDCRASMMLQDARSDAIGHQGGKMGLQFVQLRCDRQCDGQTTFVSMRLQAVHRNRGSGTVTPPNSVAMWCPRQSFRWHFPLQAEQHGPLQPMAGQLVRKQPHR